MTLTGDPLIKGWQIETPLPAIIGAGQSADAPSPDMVLAIRDRRTFRDREIRSGRGSCVRGWLRRLRDAIDGSVSFRGKLRSGRCLTTLGCIKRRGSGPAARPRAGRG